MKTYTKQIIDRHIHGLANELKNTWTQSSMIERHTMSFLDDLSEVNYTVFNRMYRHIDGSWSKSALAGELIKGNLSKVIKSLKIN